MKFTRGLGGGLHLRLLLSATMFDEVNGMMKKFVFPMVLLISSSVAGRVLSAPKISAKELKRYRAMASAAMQADMKVDPKVVQKMKTIKVGMTRAQLLQVFTTEGGVHSRMQQRYVSRQHRNWKVDVKFKPVTKSQPYSAWESRGDIITQISQPFFENAICD